MWYIVEVKKGKYPVKMLYFDTFYGRVFVALFESIREFQSMMQLGVYQDCILLEVVVE